MPHTDKSVLVVDDDDDVREALAVWLQLQGFVVREAANGREALANLTDPDQICLIVLDLFMPEMNGWAFRSAQLKDARLAQIPVVVISADPAAVKRSMSPGVVGALTKPIEFTDLLRLVNDHC